MTRTKKLWWIDMVGFAVGLGLLLIPGTVWPLVAVIGVPVVLIGARAVVK
jgi:hypothetical protein